MFHVNPLPAFSLKNNKKVFMSVSAVVTNGALRFNFEDFVFLFLYFACNKLK